MNFKTEYDKIKKNLAKQYEKLRDLQGTCPHEDLYGEYESNTGNWSPSDDRYWLHLKCDDCGKVWNIYSTEPEYRTIKFKEK
jgi:hypothetical protein